MTELEKALLLQTLTQQRNEIAELHCMTSAQAQTLTVIKQVLSSVNIKDDDPAEAVQRLARRYTRLMALCHQAQDLLEIYEEGDNDSRS